MCLQPALYILPVKETHFWDEMVLILSYLYNEKKKKKKKNLYNENSYTVEHLHILNQSQGSISILHKKYYCKSLELSKLVMKIYILL